MSDRPSSIETSALPPLAPFSLGELIPASRFTPAELSRIDQLAKAIDWSDADSIMSQMNGPNQRFADALTKQLEGVALYQIGKSAPIILELTRQIKSANLAKMKRESTGDDWVARTFGNLPVIGKYASAIRYFQLNHAKITREIERLRADANKELLQLRAAHVGLDAQERATEEVLRELMVYMAACQKATVAAREDYEKQRALALADDPDPFRLQKLRDYAENIAIMETRLVNAKASFIDKLMSIPDIRARQTAARIEMSNAIDTIYNDIPDLTSAIARLVAAYHISRAQAGNALRRANRAALADANAAALDQVYVAAKQSQSGALADIDALAARAERLIATLDRGAELDKQNAAKRADAEKKLLELRDGLVAGLKANAVRAVS